MLRNSVYLLLVNKKEDGTMAERLDQASARRKMKSPNIKTRKRALKALHDAAAQSAKK